MSYGVYTGVVVGGSGPNTWEREIEVDGDTFPLAAASGVSMAEEMGGHLFSLELDVETTGQIERLRAKEPGNGP